MTLIIAIHPMPIELLKQVQLDGDQWISWLNCVEVHTDLNNSWSQNTEGRLSCDLARLGFQPLFIMKTWTGFQRWYRRKQNNFTYWTLHVYVLVYELFNQLYANKVAIRLKPSLYHIPHICTNWMWKQIGHKYGKFYK